LAAKAATATIPIAFGVGGDPVKLGLVASLNRPGGNATGFNFFTIELVAKRMQLLRELVPAAKRIALLTNPTDLINESALRDVEAATIGQQVLVFEAATGRGIDGAFESLAARESRGAVRHWRGFLRRAAGPVSRLGGTLRGSGYLFATHVCRS